MEIALPGCCPYQYQKAFPLSEPDLVEEEKTVRTGDVWLNGEHPFLWVDLFGDGDRYKAKLLYDFLLWVNPSEVSFNFFAIFMLILKKINTAFLNLVLGFIYIYGYQWRKMYKICPCPTSPSLAGNYLVTFPLEREPKFHVWKSICNVENCYFTTALFGNRME